MAIFVLTVMEGAVMQSRAHRSIEPFDACVRQLRIHLDALKKAPAPRQRVRQDHTKEKSLMMPFLAVIASFLLAQASPVTVEKVATPAKALRFEVVVPASLDDVWNAFGTKAGMETWIWREARVDLRPGGEWTVVYTPTATGGGTIVSLIPKKQIVMSAMAPEQFPTVRKERTTATWGFESLGPTSTQGHARANWLEGRQGVGRLPTNTCQRATRNCWRSCANDSSRARRLVKDEDGRLAVFALG